MRLWRVRAVRPGALIQFGISPYRGRTTRLADGTLVRRGDRILHLHLDNRYLAANSTPGELNPWSLLELARRDLDDLAAQVASGRLGDVRAIRGVTVLAEATRRVGFEVRPLPQNVRWALIRRVLTMVLASYHPAGAKELDRGVPWPGEAWMSSRTLLRRLRPGTPSTAEVRPVELESNQ
jgi:peptidoglycan-N-acetylglucosamine deacetylase